MTFADVDVVSDAPVSIPAPADGSTVVVNVVPVSTDTWSSAAEAIGVTTIATRRVVMALTRIQSSPSVAGTLPF